MRSAYWGVHNDEDEVAYSMEKPKVRYETKKAKCRKFKTIFTTDLQRSSTHIKFLSIKKGSSSLVFTLHLKKR